MSFGILAAGLLLAQPPAADRGTRDVLVTLDKQVAELLRRERISPTARRALTDMKQDLGVLARAVAETKDPPGENYLRELKGYEAVLRSLGPETMGKEDFNTLLDLGADLRAKAEFVKHGSDTLTLRVGNAPVYHLALTADGKQLIAADDSLLKNWDLATGQERWHTRLRERGRVSALTVTPEGRLFTATQEGTITLLSADNGKIERHARTDTPIDLLVASPGRDGKLVVGRKGATLDLWAGEDLSRREVLLGDPDRQPLASFSPDGKWLCVPTPKKGVTVVNVESKKEEKVLSLERGDAAVARFTPNGKRLCAVGREGRVTVWDWPEGRVVRSWDGRQPLIWDAAVSGDSKYLATASGYRDLGGEIKLWDLESGETFKSVRFFSAITMVNFSPDGQHLVTCQYDGNVGVWSNWFSTKIRNPFDPIAVTVRTYRKGQEEKGYEVFYVSIGHAKDPPPHPSLPGVSSPAHGGIPAGRYFLWATNGANSSAKKLVTISARSNDPIDLIIP